MTHQLSLLALVIRLCNSADKRNPHGPTYATAHPIGTDQLRFSLFINRVSRHRGPRYDMVSGSRWAAK
jgi:hypothetical protein